MIPKLKTNFTTFLFLRNGSTIAPNIQRHLDGNKNTLKQWVERYSAILGNNSTNNKMIINLKQSFINQEKLK